ncbi:YceI family protein [Geodermatophilus sabuli]|uniref:YceI family protein n=1 Tax=Geodermatophilus sabuli TaxID=1564158 RepID=A0A7K3W3X5_9ACTN|nr:YceI family protein [Geodermatophilus sabuli]
MTAGVRTQRVTAGTWAVSDSRTRITFTVSNLGRPVHGSVACSWGEVEVDDQGTPVRVAAELDLESLATGIARRDSDLRKPRFLDIDRHPAMTWSADRFTGADGVGWTAHGVLRVRGTSAPLAVSAAPVAGPDGTWLRVGAVAVLDRTAVGIRAPGFLVGRTVEIAVDAWLSRRRPG